ncbi:winged helix-turn-helix domain-containing protein [Mangrovibacterium sp.]|uniref:winged helix-turn-helix domain-containing protein n=1 Tax=Mangrovibacterium sp. TaxID=1961364 RepID=UPI003569C3D0
MIRPFNVNGSLEIHKGDDCFLDSKRIALLKLVKEKGSINSASKELKMSYQQAWHFIKSMNELSPLPVIVKQRGGSNGGGTMVTRYGERIIREYEALVEKHKAFQDEINDSLWLCDF